MESYNISASRVLEQVKSSLKGLTSKEAEERLKLYGRNVLEKGKRFNALMIFLRQFKNFIVYIMIIALLLSLIIGGWIDAVIIGAIIILNAFLGFFQEYRAEKSIELLQKLSSPKASVLRDGKIMDVDSSEVVL